MSANAYSFLPWLRTGLSTRIKGEVAGARATIPVGLRLTGDALAENAEALHREITKPVQLYGPGDVVGLDPRAVSRTEPHPFAVNFEPNYLAHIEFYDEDTPWRYSPAAPDEVAKRLDPWLALIVLSAGGDSGPAEFKEGAATEQPLPFITVTEPKALQPSGELGAWAHVHVNGTLDGRIAVDTPDDMKPSLGVLSDVLRRSPDSACSRVLCPRHLKPSTTYHAFLVPAFEAGRVAGLGGDPKDIPAKNPSWTASTGQLDLPFYHRWSFTTSTVGDFEYLVRLLKPIEAQAPVGRRDMDAHRSPGYALEGVTTPTDPKGVLKLGGALQLPDSDDKPDKYENWDNFYGTDTSATPYPNQWQRSLADLINLADAYQRKTPQAANAETAAVAAGTDPVITPPLYGCWPSLTRTLVEDETGKPRPPDQVHNWVHRLNLDPRFRVAAQFGTEVVQARQEEFMAAAWNQLGDIQKANELIRAAQLARQLGKTLQGKHITPQAPPKTAAAAAGPVSGRALTLTAPAHGRVVGRPRQTALAAEPELFAVGYKVSESRVAAAPMSAPMRRITRPGSRLRKRLLREGSQYDLLVDRIDRNEVFAAKPKGAPGVTFRMSMPDFAAEQDDSEDSEETKRYKSALRAMHDGLAETAAGDPGEDQLDVLTAIDDMLAGLRAEKTLLESMAGAMNLPERLRIAVGDLIEILAYPVFDMPMYEELLKMSVETFVPNIGLLPDNSITLLENNRQFIEAYLVGLNHEMARELLWREFPTDQRGTPFRQFWDPRTVPLRAGESREAWRERLYDIPPLHLWEPAARLGENNPRQAPPSPPETRQRKDLVLVIRGELLKKYPNASIYAHKAVWPVKDGVVDKSGERTIAPLSPNAPLDPKLVLLPTYEAKIAPDLYLLGFPLEDDEAREGGEDKLGWFFVLKERPGEPRFGVDEPPKGQLPEVEVWNDITWGHVDPKPGETGFVRFDRNVTVRLGDARLDPDDGEKVAQREDDLNIGSWATRISSADVAYILFQAPVLVAVHAGEMLPNG
ncbi:hypothetical protein [Amycolatopsis sp. BJA-103]|uniref:hypothetical protein n=1 Tax=unclassified Amycolatopsis TaxID=2618356 RepID=UPI000C789E73|nr:hypothetical protein [Amycolatopsis sp. BJA-103]AUI60644.1 hypothetical protein BKN51_22270 [Amycolatopsis sp. BJA-103]PNE16671.1 hypothetical protein B1H26_25920 [Amycolatopsis sp. BJA-103]